MGKPDNVINCWFLNEDEAAMALKSKHRFCESVRPYNYFRLTQWADTLTLQGWIGHGDVGEDFHELCLDHFTYFRDYRDRKMLYLTFDQVSLYKVIDIYPSKPLVFTLQHITDLTPIADMISPEEIYQLLIKEKWSEIINILHKNKAGIASEPCLAHAAKTFEGVLISNVDNYPLENRAIIEVLEKAYMIHHGQFYVFSDQAIRMVTLQLAKRLPLKDGYNYAKDYPDDPVAKEIIGNFSRVYFDSENASQKGRQLSRNWTEIFNRLFELINDDQNGITYFSGPRFIKVVREVFPYQPEYNQFIELRNKEGKSTSRKMFFYDILMDADEYSRNRIVDKIIESVRSFYPDKVRAIDMLMGKEVREDTVITATQSNIQPDENPVVFISYSWDDDNHSTWVQRLAERLYKDGIKVILDRYELRPGKSLPHFIERSIAGAHRILVIFTPNYRLKADNRAGGVGYEYSIMNAKLYQDQINNEKVIPVLRSGTMQESIPEFMQQYIHLDLRDDDKFEVSYLELIREIYNDPAIKVPKIGMRPTFDTTGSR